jgi:hypothetical protein
MVVARQVSFWARALACLSDASLIADIVVYRNARSTVRAGASGEIISASAALPPLIPGWNEQVGSLITIAGKEA